MQPNREDVWPVGTPVEVRTRFERSWAHGYEVAEGVRPDGAEPRYRVRRTSDGEVVPASFSPEELRVEDTRG